MTHLAQEALEEQRWTPLGRRLSLGMIGASTDLILWQGPQILAVFGAHALRFRDSSDSERPLSIAEVGGSVAQALFRLLGGAL